MHPFCFRIFYVHHSFYEVLYLILSATALISFTEGPRLNFKTSTRWASVSLSNADPSMLWVRNFWKLDEERNEMRGRKSD